MLGAAIYGLAGDSGLRAFYDENNVKRFPGMSANLEQAAWVLKVCKLPSAISLLKLILRQYLGDQSSTAHADTLLLDAVRFGRTCCWRLSSSSNTQYYMPSSPTG